MTAKTTITFEAIEPFVWGGAGNGNVYRYMVTHSEYGCMLSTCERDVAYWFERAGLATPEELEGPYDGYGRRQ